MDEVEQAAQKQREAQMAGERLLQRLKMEAQDEILIKNPLDRDFVIKNFGDTMREVWVFPSKDKDIGYGSGKKVVPRYVANAFRERVFVDLVAAYNAEFISKEKAKWKGNITDWPEQQRNIEKRTGGNHASVAEMIKLFFPVFEWQVYRKYGMDDLPEGSQEQSVSNKVVSLWDTMTAEAEKENPTMASFAEQVAA